MKQENYKFKVIKESGPRVGLLGGTFNPAHEGHLAISLEAIKRLHLDYVIWLITPQNPLKGLKVADTLKKRVSEAIHFTAYHPKIRTSDIEEKLGSNYTVDTIKKLKLMHPKYNFVWLMGADNLQNFHKWKNWEHIIKICPIAIFDRDNFSKLLLYSHLTLRYKKNGRVKRHYTGKLIPNSWYYFMIKKIPISSTTIRTSINKT